MAARSSGGWGGASGGMGLAVTGASTFTTTDHVAGNAAGQKPGGGADHLVAFPSIQAACNNSMAYAMNAPHGAHAVLLSQIGGKS